MDKDSANKKLWTKPALKRLGKIGDVNGAQTPVAQAAGGVKS